MCVYVCVCVCDWNVCMCVMCVCVYVCKIHKCVCMCVCVYVGKYWNGREINDTNAERKSKKKASHKYQHTAKQHQRQTLLPQQSLLGLGLVSFLYLFFHTTCVCIYMCVCVIMCDYTHTQVDKNGQPFLQRAYVLMEFDFRPYNHIFTHAQPGRSSSSPFFFFFFFFHFLSLSLSLSLSLTPTDTHTHTHTHWFWFFSFWPTWSVSPKEW